MANAITGTPEETRKSAVLESRIKIGGTIRTIRENRALSQEQLAEKMNISRSTISKIESGKFNCSIDYLWKFGYVLQFEVVLQEYPNDLHNAVIPLNG